MNAHTTATATTAPAGAAAALTLAAMLKAIRRPEVARPLAAALGVENVDEAFSSKVYELDHMVCTMRQAAFGLRVLGAGLASGLDLQQPEAEGIRGLMDGMERPIQECCDKINSITGYSDY